MGINGRNGLPQPCSKPQLILLRAAAAAMSADFEGLPTRGGTSVDQELPR